MNYNSWPAARQVAASLASTAVAAKAACEAIRPNFRYKAIYFNVAKIADVIDSTGHVESVTTAVGGIYPLDNCGIQTGGNTTIAQGEFILLYD